MKVSQLSALATVDPDACRRRILDALDSASGDRETAAQALGVSVRTLYRWVRELGLWRRVEAVDREHGRADRPRPPRRDTVARTGSHDS